MGGQVGRASRVVGSIGSGCRAKGGGDLAVPTKYKYQKYFYSQRIDLGADPRIRVALYIDIGFSQSK